MLSYRDSAGEPNGHSPITGVDLRAPFRLSSADDLQYPFSNYVRGYSGLLDYVWYQPEHLQVGSTKVPDPW
jgi:mRNA deadenylase 3'-5' endonuclease subunit Ccr4